MPDLATAVAAEEAGDHAAARPLYEQIVAGPALPAEHVEAMVRLAVMKQGTYEPEAARTLYDRALALAENELGRTHPWTARTLHELGTMLLSSELEAGCKLIERSELAWRDSGLPDEVRICLGRAWLHAAKNEPDAALEQHRLAAATAARVLPVRHTDRRLAQAYYADELWKAGKQPECLAVYKQSLAMFDGQLEHTYSALAIANVAWTQRTMGDRAGARATLSHYLARMRAELGNARSRLHLLSWWRRFLDEEPASKNERLGAFVETFPVACALDGEGSPTVTSLANELAAAADAAAQTAQIIPTLEETWRAALKRVEPANLVSICTLTSWLARFQLKEGRSADAQRLALELVAQTERIHGIGQPLAQVLETLGNGVDWAPGFLEPLLGRAIALRESIQGPVHDDLRAPLDSLAYLLDQLQRPTQAREARRRVMAIWEHRLSPERPEVDGWGLDAVVNDIPWDQPDARREHWTRAIAHAEKRLGAEHQSVGVLLAQLARQLSYSMSSPAQQAQTLTTLERALAIARKSGEDSARVADVLQQMAEFHQYPLVQPVQTLALRRRVLAIREKLAERSPRLLAHCEVAKLLIASDLAAGKEEWARLLAWISQEPNADREHASVLDQMSELELARGERDAGLAHGAKAVELYEKAWPGSMHAAWTLDRLGVALLEGGQPLEAEEHFCLALPLYEKHLGPKADQTVVLLDRLAEALIKLGRPEEAATRLTEAIARDGRKYDVAAVPLNRLAALRIAEGKHEEARSLLERALALATTGALHEAAQALLKSLP